MYEVLPTPFHLLKGMFLSHPHLLARLANETPLPFPDSLQKLHSCLSFHFSFPNHTPSSESITCSSSSRVCKGMLANKVNSFPSGLRGESLFKALQDFFFLLGGGTGDTSQVCALTQPVDLQRMLVTPRARTQQEHPVESPVARNMRVCSANHF